MMKRRTGILLPIRFRRKRYSTPVQAGRESFFPARFYHFICAIVFMYLALNMIITYTIAVAGSGMVPVSCPGYIQHIGNKAV